MPAVSVLMAVHDAERYLKEAVESILDQTFRDFEFLVVDDGSTDATGAILSNYTDSRLRVIRLENNGGLPAALNIGLREACGPLIARMDGDDVSDTRRLELQVAFMHEYPDVLLLGTGFVRIDAAGRPFDKVQLPTEDGVLQGQLLVGSQFCHPSVMVRTDIMRAVGGYRSISGGAAQDYDLWLRIAEHGKIANLQQPLLRYRMHEGQISVGRLERQRQAANIYRTLALQRRSGLGENLDAAQRENASDGADMTRAVSAEYRLRALRFAVVGQRLAAMKFLLESFRLTPADPRVVGCFFRILWGELESSRVGVMLRWYGKKMLALRPRGSR